MKSKNNLNLNINRFKTPKGYFDKITIDDINKIELGDFKVPENYFETINTNFIIKTNYRSKLINFKYKELAYSGIAAAIVVGLFISVFFNDSNTLNENEIIEYMDYELVGYSSSEYLELFDVNEFEINFEEINNNDFDYFIETSFSDDQNLNNE
ncbi:hypothetical protein N8915_00725 [Flavobacteriaceae bacterium]|nr:hypothetical protein [Flavobacteriaceae bacterium]MDA8937942.1 hypothetical protein [Flavobacteriaceae bacterium]